MEDEIRFLKRITLRIKYWLEERLEVRCDLGMRRGAMEGSIFNPALLSISAGLGN